MERLTRKDGLTKSLVKRWVIGKIDGMMVDERIDERGGLMK